MSNLTFKKVGHYLEENSARYEANFKGLVVRVWKCPSWKGFTFSFIDSNGFELTRLTGDFLSNWFDGATKKQTIERLEGIFSDGECLETLKSQFTKA